MQLLLTFDKMRVQVMIELYQGKSIYNGGTHPQKIKKYKLIKLKHPYKMWSILS
jgi:hypothetical protein